MKNEEHRVCYPERIDREEFHSCHKPKRFTNAIPNEHCSSQVSRPNNWQLTFINISHLDHHRQRWTQKISPRFSPWLWVVYLQVSLVRWITQITLCGNFWIHVCNLQAPITQGCHAIPVRHDRSWHWDSGQAVPLNVAMFRQRSTVHSEWEDWEVENVWKCSNVCVCVNFIELLELLLIDLNCVNCMFFQTIRWFLQISVTGHPVTLRTPPTLCLTGGVLVLSAKYQWGCA